MLVQKIVWFRGAHSLHLLTSLPSIYTGTSSTIQFHASQNEEGRKPTYLKFALWYIRKDILLRQSKLVALHPEHALSLLVNSYP